MTHPISDWISKAEGDWSTMSRESVVTEDPAYGAVCFHAQQCAEKYLKARLVMADIEFRYSHDLLYLHKLVLSVEPGWNFLHDSLKKLTIYAIAARYPGMDATAEQADLAVEHCRVVRTTIRSVLLAEDES